MTGASGSGVFADWSAVDEMLGDAIAERRLQAGKTILVGIAGAQGSGKTTLVRRLAAELELRAKALADFLRRGLVAPTLPSTLGDAARRGQALFNSKTVGCAECHVPATSYTTRQPYPLPALAVRAGFDDEPDAKFKIPSLAFLAGRAPYFHDGSATSLEQLVEKNGNRMGKTAQLSAAERADLVAFLKTL